MIGSKIKLAPVPRRETRQRMMGEQGHVRREQELTSEVKVMLPCMSVRRSAGVNVRLVAATPAGVTNTAQQNAEHALEVGVNVFSGRLDVPRAGSLIR